MAGYTPGEQPVPGERSSSSTPMRIHFHQAQGDAGDREIEREMLRRYPNPTADRFRESAAKLLDVSPDMIIARQRQDRISSPSRSRRFSPPVTPGLSRSNVFAVSGIA